MRGQIGILWSRFACVRAGTGFLMSHRSPSPTHHPSRPAHPLHRHGHHPHDRSHRPPQPSQSGSDYAFVHGRMQVRIGPVAFWSVVASLVLMAGWSAVTATYFAFRDDV